MPLLSATHLAALDHPQPQVRLLAVDCLAARAEGEFRRSGGGGGKAAAAGAATTATTTTASASALFLRLCASAAADDWPAVRAAALAALERGASGWARLPPLAVRLAALNKRATLPRALFAESAAASSSPASSFFTPRLLDQGTGALLLACEDECSGVRAAAARALAALGAADAEVACGGAADALCLALARDDPDRAVRREAVRCVARWFEAHGAVDGADGAPDKEEAEAAVAAAATAAEDDADDDEEGEIVMSEAEAEEHARKWREQQQKRSAPASALSLAQAEALAAAVDCLLAAVGSGGREAAKEAWSVLAERAVLPHRASLLSVAQELDRWWWDSLAEGGGEWAAAAAGAIARRHASLVRGCRGDLLRLLRRRRADEMEMEEEDQHPRGQHQHPIEAMLAACEE